MPIVKSQTEHCDWLSITIRQLRAPFRRQGLSIHQKPESLRPHSATLASRNGVPLEIISKVLLRHQNLKTTQLCLGRISEAETIRWMISFTANDSIAIRHLCPVRAGVNES
jgi:hypothetical protein